MLLLPFFLPYSVICFRNDLAFSATCFCRKNNILKNYTNTLLLQEYVQCYVDVHLKKSKYNFSFESCSDPTSHISASLEQNGLSVRSDCSQATVHRYVQSVMCVTLNLFLPLYHFTSFLSQHFDNWLLFSYKQETATPFSGTHSHLWGIIQWHIDHHITQMANFL